MKVPPHSMEAEMAVLGAMLIDKDAIDSVKEVLESKHFYLDKHRKIFEAICELNLKDEPVELLTVAEYLKKNNKLDEIGGQKYLGDLMEKVSTPAHTQNYAKLVKEKALLRDIINISTTLIEKSYSGQNDVENILDYGQNQILLVAQKSTDHGFQSTYDLRMKISEQLENAYKEKKLITGIPTGFKKFDEITSGLQKADLIILAARPSQGKTAMALNIAYHAAVENKKTVAIFSLEMNWASLYQRMICSAARVNMREIRSGFFRRDSWPLLSNEISKISEAGIWMDDTPALDILDIRTRTRKLVNQLRARNQTLDLIIIDYIQLIRSHGRRENRQQEVSEISRLLKDLARSLNIPVLALSQLNRRTEDKSREGGKPQLSDLRESGSLEQDADVVALIYRPGLYNREDPELRNKAQLIIAKQRNGPVGIVELNFIEECTKFVNPAPPGVETMQEEEEVAL